MLHTYMYETLRDINEKNDDEDNAWSASQTMLIHWSCILLGLIIWNTQISAYVYLIGLFDFKPR